MPAQRQSCCTPYNYSEETLTCWISCLNCGKEFKPQGFKKHEVNCNAQSLAEKESAQVGRHFGQVLKGEYTWTFKVIQDSEIMSMS